MTQKLPEPMLQAFTEAEKAAEMGEVPVGAVITDKLGNILAIAGNRTLVDHDPTAHAEMLVIREVVVKLGSERMVDCDMYVTLEPCAMCAAAISFARIRRLYYGASDEKMGAVEHGPVFFAQPTCHHKPEVYGGIGELRSQKLLRGFFKNRR
jgi:tRNA(adenine34) deaminase